MSRPSAALVDQAALERIGERWELARDHWTAYAGPTLIVAGRLDSTVGYAAREHLPSAVAHDLIEQRPTGRHDRLVVGLAVLLDYL